MAVVIPSIKTMMGSKAFEKMTPGETPTGTGPLKDISTSSPFNMLQANIQTQGGYPVMSPLEMPIDQAGQFTNLLQKPTFDLVSPWQKMAGERVQTGYQDTLAKNLAMQSTSARQAGEGLAMEGGVSARQTARLADRALQNRLMNDQLTEQQRQQNQLRVAIGGEEMGKQQEQYLAGKGLETDLTNQKYSMGNVQNMNAFIAKLVEEAIKRQQGKDMGAAL